MSSKALTRPSGRASAMSALPAEKKRKRPVNRSSLLLIGLFLIPLGLLFLPTTLLLAVGLVPTFVALIVDRDPDKYAAITVGPINLCGILPAAMTLWADGHTMSLAVRLMADPVSWLTMYGAAAAGWMIFFSVPPAVAAYLAHRHEAEIRKMTDHQEKLVEEWGPEVAQSAANLRSAR